MIKNETISKIKSSFALDINGVHGLGHWARVLDNGMKIAETNGANVKVIQAFALLHDCCRENEYGDSKHGFRAAQLICKYFKNSLNNFESYLLYEACSLHTQNRTHLNLTVRTCFDADRLDLPRVGIAVDPKQLCTDEGKDLIPWATENALYGIIPGNILGWSI